MFQPTQNASASSQSPSFTSYLTPYGPLVTRARPCSTWGPFCPSSGEGSGRPRSYASERPTLRARGLCVVCLQPILWLRRRLSTRKGVTNAEERVPPTSGVASIHLAHLRLARLLEPGPDPSCLDSRWRGWESTLILPRRAIDGSEALSLRRASLHYATSYERSPQLGVRFSFSCVVSFLCSVLVFLFIVFFIFIFIFYFFFANSSFAPLEVLDPSGYSLVVDSPLSARHNSDLTDLPF